MNKGTSTNPPLSRAASAKLASSLTKAAPYPHPVSRVRLIETHISWVVLTGQYAYKLKRPLDLGFLDFSTLEKRKTACEEEVRLNCRLAAQLYVGVVAVAGSPEAPRIAELSDETAGPVIDYAVQMRQFPQTAQLDRELAAGVLEPADLEQVGRRIAAFHQSLAGVETDFGTFEQVVEPVRDNFTALSELTGDDATDSLERLRLWTEAAISLLEELIRSRHAQGWIRECHGDLHLSNLVRLADGITAFDCIEFDPALRWSDVICEVAFLYMDLLSRGRRDLAYRFLNAYLAETGDYEGLRLLRFYAVYRSLVRAKIAAIRISELIDNAPERRTQRDKLRLHLDLAETLIDRSEPLLILTTGLAASGKTTTSKPLAASLPAIHLRSDLERKRLFGFGELEDSHSPPGQRLYAPEASRRTYERLLDLASILLRSGFSVIVDAAAQRESERGLFGRLAGDLEVPFVILHFRADVSVLRRRIRQRQSGGRDASEADLTILQWQLEHAEPISTEPATIVTVDTRQAVEVDELADTIRRRATP